jgi:hypothetical protein
MITYCEANATNIYDDSMTFYDSIVAIIDNTVTSTRLTTATDAFATVTDDINGAVYNCFFSFTTPAVAAGYTTSLSVSLVMWNLLFNLGFMYTDIYGIIY